MHSPLYSKQCVGAGGSATKKTNSVSPAEEVMATVFWNSRVHIDYLEKGSSPMLC